MVEGKGEVGAEAAGHVPGQTLAVVCHVPALAQERPRLVFWGCDQRTGLGCTPSAARAAVCGRSGGRVHPSVQIYSLL